jgi:Signal transduction histidine kinase
VGDVTLLDKEDRNSALELQTEAAYDFMRDMPLPAFIIDRDRDIYLANTALSAIFGYEDGRTLSDKLRQGEFLSSHFSPEVMAQFYELLTDSGQLRSWLMHGWSLDGRELTLEITARGRLGGVGSAPQFLEGYFTSPGNVRDAEAFLQKAKKEAELAAKAKTEFLSNISHELRTPLNIIIGMLGLAVEDESINEDQRANLGLAKEAADGLFTILNDLIVLSNLEARRLDTEIAQFSPQILLQTLARQFAAKAEAKGVGLRVEGDEHCDSILDGGYNLIVLALEKLVDNAIKFVEAKEGQVLIRALVLERGDGPWLHCSVLDNGPGLDQCFLESQDLFRQGDSSINRRYGGLGLGLRLAANLVAALGGSFKLANCEGGGAELSFRIPVKFSSL